jgi:GMP synthase-like glutamine amidotransferase
VHALLLANVDDADPGFVGEHLRARGYQFTPCWRERPGEWTDLEGVELVVSLGSDWSVYWDHVRQSVSAETDLLRRAHERGVPTLGICFGGQILAHTLGGRVERAPEPEVGWFDVTSDVPALEGRGPWFQWHVDRFTAPPAAVRLASSPRGEQAFRLGRTLGLQFHPEVDVEIVGRWVEGGATELSRLGLDGDTLVRRTGEESERTHADAGTLVAWFCEECVGADPG